MKVKDIMTQDPACCVPDTSLEEVALMMCEHDCGEIPVVENERNMTPIGVITDRDIACRTVAQGKNPLHMKAQDCMTKPCLTVTPDSSLEECLALLEEHQIRRVPVVDEEGRCVGIVSQADIAASASYEDTAEFLKEVSSPE